MSPQRVSPGIALVFLHPIHTLPAPIGQPGLLFPSWPPAAGRFVTTDERVTLMTHHDLAVFALTMADGHIDAIKVGMASTTRAIRALQQ